MEGGWGVSAGVISFKLKFCNLYTFRILSCNAENASDSLPPLDFTEANDIVKTASRGLSDNLLTDGQV